MELPPHYHDKEHCHPNDQNEEIIYANYNNSKDDIIEYNPEELSMDESQASGIVLPI